MLYESKLKAHLYCLYPSRNIYLWDFHISFVKLKGYGGKFSVKNMPLEGLLINVFLSLSMILHLTKVNNC